ncbi:hypothetical protein C8T65DRAFT_569982 [Cerioporus squamosus]|nr:hypothetical protein C8T65DRAFT_569982 [Cerioporus squamosus]
MTIRCTFSAVATLARTKMIHILWMENTTYTAAAENAFLRSNTDPSGIKDMVSYRASVNHFILEHLFPALANLAPDTLQLAPYFPVFLASSTNDSVMLRPGLPNVFLDSQSSWLQRLPLRSASQFSASVSVLYIDITSLQAIEVFSTGSRDVMLVTLPNNTLVVSQCVPTIAMVTSPSGLSVIGEAVIHEMDILRAIPPHPNIVTTLAYITRKFNSEIIVCGFALKYCPGGCIADMVDSEVVVLDPHLLMLKQWAYQMSSALRHIHHVAQTYHGDIKLNNLVLDEHDNTIFIDSEQCRTNEEGAPPELHADCTVVPLVPLRQRDYPYDHWKDVPRAIEASEVYTFAVALGDLFKQGELEGDILERCRHVDPNQRVEHFLQALYTTI